MKKAVALLVTVSMLCSGTGVFAALNDTTKHNTEISAERKLESLDRGLVVQSLSSGGTYLTWRLLLEEDNAFGTASDNVAFNIYKNGTLLATENYTTNYVDADGTSADKYQVAPVKSGIEGDKCAEVFAFSSGSNYFDIMVDKPDSMLLPRTATFENASGNSYINFVDSNGNELSSWRDENAVWDETAYSLGDASCGDLDGDGEYEIVVKWECGSKDNSQTGLTGTVYLDAYEMDGTKLWRIDLGRNIRAGAHYTQFLVYDFDGDGKAEVACKTAPGSIDGAGNHVSAASSVATIKNVDNTAVYINDSGYILEGDEFYTVFNGKTGAAIDTIYYPVDRYPINGWGNNESYGNRVDRFVGGVAYLDGVTPSIISVRGYYGRTTVAAMNLEEGRLVTKIIADTADTADISKYHVTSNECVIQAVGTKFQGQGNHNLSIADVDCDGKDEVILGSICFDDDLSVLWSSGRGHGDALHIGDYDPTNDGLEFFEVHESGGYTITASTTSSQGKTADYGMTVHSANDGVELLHISAGGDTGRGMMANVGSGGYYQVWSSGTSAYKALGGNSFEETTVSGASTNFRIYWDGDLYDELLDGVNISNWNGVSMTRIFTAGGCSDNNGSKANPALSADLFGDWREEVVYRLSDNTALRVFTTNIPTEYKMKTLMHDSLYRSGVAAEQAAYNQPPHVSMYMDRSSVLGDLVEASITREPLRKSYLVGEQLDITGLKVQAQFERGPLTEITDYKISGFDSSTVGTQNVEVRFNEELVGKFEVTVSENGSSYYNNNFDEYTAESITMARQNKENQTQQLGSLILGIGSRSGGGDYTSGFGIVDTVYGNVLKCYSGNYATASRGAYFTFAECNLPRYSELADAKLIIDFNAYYHDENSTIQFFGVTSSGTGNSNGFFDPYLSVKNNSNIPVGEWVNIKIEIDSSKNVNLAITDMDGDIVYNTTSPFTASGEYVDKVAFYGTASTLDIGYLSVSTTDSVGSIEIVQTPDVTKYVTGEELDITGLVVNAVYKSGAEREITNYEISGFDKDIAGTQEVTVSYNGKTATFEVEVLNVVEQLNITSYPTKRTYNVGEELDLSGIAVQADYGSGIIRDITDYTVSGFDADIPGLQTITVSYNDAKVTFEVTVNDVLTGIEVTTLPDKTRYNLGEELDLAGLVVSEVYASGNEKVISDYTVSGFESETSGQKTLIITYGDYTAELNVTVLKAGDIYFEDDFNSYTASDITMGKQGTVGQSQDLGELDLAIGARSNGNGDGKSGFDIVEGSDNTYLKITSGGTATAQRGASFTFDEVCAIPDYGELEENKSLYFEFDVMFTDSASNMTIDGVTGTPGKSSTLVSDPYLSLANNSSLTTNEWLTVLIGVDNANNATLIVKDGDNNIINEESYTLPSVRDVRNKFTFYGYTSVIYLDNLSAYSDYTVTSLEITEPEKTEYIIGEAFNTAGMVINAVYSDGTKAKITDYDITAPDMTTEGSKIITVSYSTASATFEVTVAEENAEKTLSGISIASKPEKLEYFEGEKLDLSGIIVNALYTDSTFENITDYEVSGFDSSVIGEQTITVSYSGKTATFTVKVIAKTFSKIEITSNPTKVEYKEKESLDLSGLVVKAVYDNGDEEGVTGYSISGYDASKIGEQTITVSYNGKTATFTVTVVAKTLTKIEITSLPGKTEYKEGESLDTTGLAVKAVYDNGDEEGVTGYSISGYDASKIGEQTITVSYNGKTATFTVKVISSVPAIAIRQNTLKYENNILTGKIIAGVDNNDKQGVLILAVYDADGVVKAMSIKAVTKDEDVDFGEISKELNKGYYYKIFAWESLQGAKCIVENYNSLVNK